ncbi:MAG: phosphate signaling complex PhoU family protein [Acidimicrobiales bacterium]
MAIHPRAAFDQALDDLQSEIVTVASAVPEAMAAAVEALLGSDHDQARSVVDSHPAAAETALRCEAHAYELMARQQPTAGDLRLLTTLVRLAHEIERSSKLVRHVADFATRPTTAIRSPKVRGLLSRMGDEAGRLYQGAIDAYVDRDLAGAEALEVWDDRMDELHRQLLAELFVAELGLEMTLELALIGRYIERVADHAVIIGDRVRYLMTGQLSPPVAPG